MSENSQAASPPEHFTSAKTTAAIPIRHPAIRDALIQFSLDAAVRSIEYIESATVGSEVVDVDAIVVQGEGGRSLLDIIPARPLRDLEEEGLALMALGELNIPTRALTSEDLRREPRFSNSRLVWLYNRHHVPLDLRLGILKLLSEQPSMKLGDLLQGIKETGSRGSRAVMSLACADLISLDLESQPLGPNTMVTLRTPYQRS
ncbi:hypothetical protein FXV83_38040 [Bradyrhizobium hipponense]|uniref:Uncharacterized protein n=1 Tax=Bradyrhizobium hipponense TaxID=2605638 RepID=A0A5S4YAP7_9BRAD|nr:hypothetical protein [Bradyrhizobium hipponense]TYO61486.1 hypothetical protein FXV83_38040 [Bradyrhizobium hipponense]